MRAPLRVVYLDDEPDLCTLFSEMFTNENTRVITYSEPGAAIDAINSTAPDLIFLDYRLPGITGDEVASSVKKLIPMVLVTGELNITPQNYFTKIVHKPFRRQEIEAIIASLRPKA